MDDQAVKSYIDEQIKKGIEEYELGYKKSQVLDHIHNGIDAQKIDIADIARFPSTAANGDVPVYNTTTKRWEASTGSTSVEARSTNTANTSIVNATFTKIQLSTNSFANGITWDAGNNQFTIVTTGYYLVTGQTTYTNIAGATQYLLEIRNNGSQIVQVSHGGTATWDLGMTGTDVVSLTAGDVLELYTRQNSGGNQNISNSNTTHLSIAQV